MKANIASGINHATPLMYASNAPIARILLSAGANVNAKDDFGNTALLEACDKDKNGVIKVLLAAGADVNSKNKHGETPIQIAKEWIQKKETRNEIITLLQSAKAIKKPKQKKKKK